MPSVYRVIISVPRNRRYDIFMKLNFSYFLYLRTECERCNSLHWIDGYGGGTGLQAVTTE